MKQPLVLTLVGVALALGFGAWLYLQPGPQQQALQTRELATRGLAEYLARTYPGQRALVISNPYTKAKAAAGNMSAYEEAGRRGLRLGFGRQIAVEAVVFPELKPGALENPRAFIVDPQTPTPLSYLMREDAFDKLAQQHPGCRLFVSLIGLPADLSKVAFWPDANAPKLALLLPDLQLVGDTTAVRDAMKSGRLAAFVLNKPGAPPEQEPPGRDVAAEFARRFVLVTPESIDSVLQTWPQLF